MPVDPSYPGVFIEEVPGPGSPITGVTTSVAAFIGYTCRGADNRATHLSGFAEYERSFGSPAPESEVSHAVRLFFANGGTEAWVVRVPKRDATAASITLLDRPGSAGRRALQITATGKGGWANGILVDINYDGVDAADPRAFNLTVTDLGSGASERFLNVTLNSSKASFAPAVINDPSKGSKLVQIAILDPQAGRPAQTGTEGGDIALGDIKNDRAYSIKISSDLPDTGEITNIEVNFIDAGESIPGSIPGVCDQFEKKANAALRRVLPGVAIHCVPSSSGSGIRVHAQSAPDQIPGAQDARIEFSAGSPNSALELLGLGTAIGNVSQYVLGTGRTMAAQTDARVGVEGTDLPGNENLIGRGADFSGIYALEKVDIFNILCIPDATRAKPGDPSHLDDNLSPNDIFGAAISYCAKRRAFLLIDPPPDVDGVAAAANWKTSALTVHHENGAAYFPRIRIAELSGGPVSRTVAPCGVVAGLYARVDASRGVWKAPAGLEAALDGVEGPAYQLTDTENSVLNPLGLNCFRSFPGHGTVAWGARTLVGADIEASEWKYVPVRRFALFLEESIRRGTQWAVFEPDDERLWSQIRLSIGTFLHSLFLRGAFQGVTPREAYLVKCDQQTTTQDDVDRGLVNILVGFAPLKPAEFIFIRIQQLAGQTGI